MSNCIGEVVKQSTMNQRLGQKDWIQRKNEYGCKILYEFLHLFIFSDDMNFTFQNIRLQE